MALYKIHKNVAKAVSLRLTTVAVCRVVSKLVTIGVSQGGDTHTNLRVATGD